MIVMKKLFLYILAFSFTLGITSCSEDKFTDSIFIDTEYPDPNSPTYEFDLWLYNNYIKTYNLQFRYKMEDVGSAMDYNLVPCDYDVAQKMARLVKHLWFDVYKDIVDEEFLKYYGPRIIHLIGSPAYNAAQGSEILGTAEGGLKVTLYKCNDMDVTNINMLNTYYFKTMHHEFAHILHQKKSYPKEFDQICAGNYLPDGWTERSNEEANKLGFVTNYASSEGREDFVETIANFIIMNDKEWEAMLKIAAKGTVNGQNSRTVIEQKLQICKTWLRNSWEIDLDALRADVLSRQDNLDIDELMKE